MGCCEDTLRSLIQLSGGSPETRLGISEWQEVLVAKTLKAAKPVGAPAVELEATVTAKAGESEAADKKL